DGMRRVAGSERATHPPRARRRQHRSYDLAVIKVVVSACLLGSPVRHDARDKKCDHAVLQRWIEEGRVISVCPEMSGGLGTPRPPAEIVNDGSRRVVTRDGADVTIAFENGARAAAEQGRVDDV